MIKHPKKPTSIKWISEETWDCLNLKEKDYLIFLYVREFTQEQIQRRIYLETSHGWNKFKYRLKRKLKRDLDKFTLGV